MVMKANCIFRNPCEIAKSPYYQNFPVQLILRNCEIEKSVQYVIRICNVQMILRNQFSI